MSSPVKQIVPVNHHVSVTFIRAPHLSRLSAMMGIDINGNMVLNTTADIVTHKTTDIVVGGLVVDRVRGGVGYLCSRWHRCTSCHWPEGTGRVVRRSAAGRDVSPPRSSKWW